jgi:hypothetical protein
MFGPGDGGAWSASKNCGQTSGDSALAQARTGYGHMIDPWKMP